MSEQRTVSLWDLFLYFARLSALGFGGPIAITGYIQRDLLEKRKWITDEEFKLGLALAQTMPGPLAAQIAIWIGYLRQGYLGTIVVFFAYITPSFLIVLALSILYTIYGGLHWVRAVFHGVGPAIAAIITIAAWRLAVRTIGKNIPLWVVFAILAIVTALARTEIAWLFIMAGVIGMLLENKKWKFNFQKLLPAALPILSLPALSTATQSVTLPLLAQMALFFGKSGAFVFGSGLVIVPFLYHGVVEQFRWISESQFRDAVAIGMITPGPVLNATAFIGYLTAGFPGAAVAFISVFTPVYLFTVIPAPWVKRLLNNRSILGFANGVTAAAAGAMAGSVYILSRGSITDFPTMVIAIVSLAMLTFAKIPETLLVLLAGLVGLLL